MVAVSLKLTPYARRFRHEVLNLANDGRCRLHLHLDWHLLDEWIDQNDTPIFLAWHNQKLLGVMAGSPPQADSSWLRMVALEESADPDTLLAELWGPLSRQLAALGVRHVGALLIQPWLSTHLGKLGFQYVQHIITLRREGIEVPSPLRDDLVIRHTDTRDTMRALEIDHAAFDPMWQMNAIAMRQAIRNSASFTIAELDGRLVGYQITTLHMRSAHLARLAVLPGVQGGGIGGALLEEMIVGFLRRGVFSVSVNTQGLNIKSRRLYERYGFMPTGLDMPFWTVELPA